MAEVTAPKVVARAAPEIPILKNFIKMMSKMMSTF